MRGAAAQLPPLQYSKVANACSLSAENSVSRGLGIFTERFLILDQIATAKRLEAPTLGLIWPVSSIDRPCRFADQGQPCRRFTAVSMCSNSSSSLKGLRK